MKVLALYSLPSFWSMGEGKGATAFSRTLEALARRGHEVRVLAPAEAGKGASIETFAGCTLIRRPAEASFLPNPDLPLIARLRERWTHWRAYQKWGLHEAMLLAREEKPDLVLSLGVFETPVAHHVARKIGTNNATRLFGNNLALNLDDPLRFYANFPEVIAFRTPTSLFILTNDGANGDAVARRCGVKRGVFHHLRNGLEFSRFIAGERETPLRARLGLREEDPLLITVTRLASEKKLERAIAGLKGLRARFPGARLALLGDGPERERLTALVRAEGVEGNVDFVGAVHQAELPDWYRSADFVLSLLDRTNASNPVFEAMACGRVVAALDVGTTREVVLNDATGLLLHDRDLPRLGEILADCFADAHRMRRLGLAAARHIRTLLVEPSARLDLEVDLYEQAARR